MPKLEVFAPHERSVYYYTTAESKFNLKQYKEAIPYYEKTLTVCYEREKGDVYLSVRSMQYVSSIMETCI